ncbi:hypothetical protein MTBBW1_1360002 [Desulfamplus magnetovallimortis]|uniref:Uncharacterized protein n=1 Tax=Desulfamplus magnetovallimortis TaxID=1246637 RepID=A0A1W1H7T3_9BACT|nr:hypothetical protein MTBBW1_1360002 [Desulfamplus magnetovallimortis]
MSALTEKRASVSIPSNRGSVSDNFITIKNEDSLTSQSPLIGAVFLTFIRCRPPIIVIKVSIPSNRGSVSDTRKPGTR